MIQKTFHIIFCFLLMSVPVFSQTHRIDSLKKLVNDQPGENRPAIETVFELCEQYPSMHPDTFSHYLSLARTMAGQSGNKSNIAFVNYFQAVLFTKEGKTDSALELIEQNLQIGTKISQMVRNRCLVAKTNYLIRSNHQKEAIELGLDLLRESEKENDAVLAAKAKTLIGWAYMELGQQRNALDWFFKALKGLSAGVVGFTPSVTCSNIASVYIDMGKNDSAEIFVHRAIAYSEQEENLSFLANAYYVYADICIADKNDQKAEELMQQALQIRKQVGDPFYIVSDIAELGAFYAKTGQAAKGIEIIKEGINIAKGNDLEEKLPLLYTGLAENYKAAGDLNNYSTTLSTIIDLKDSLYKHNSAQALSEMQTKYEVQKKENTIIHQKYDLTRQNYFIYGIAGLLAATLLFGYVLLRNRRRTQQLKLRQLEAEQKQKTTQAIMQAEEEERKRIAGDLHDSVAQKMVVAKMNLESLGNQLGGLREPQQKIYNNISDLLEESAAEVRNLSHSMMPQAFAHSGLTDAVKDFLDKIGNNNLKVHFSATGNFKMIPENKALMIYRIIQEAVQNVLKHAKASQLDIAMIAEKNELDITIEDNGVGFDHNALTENSMGMKNIRSRTEYLGGKLDINSRPGQGTLLAFFIPGENAI